ncbi:Uncharacterized protein FWK35_00011203, partial [Aphis craccivora]
QVVTVVTGKAAAAVTGKRVRRLRARRRAIQRCVCAKKKKSARATRARTGNVTVAETLPFAGVGVGRETAYRLEVVTSQTPRAEATAAERIDRCIAFFRSRRLRHRRAVNVSTGTGNAPASVLWRSSTAGRSVDPWSCPIIHDELAAEKEVAAAAGRDCIGSAGTSAGMGRPRSHHHHHHHHHQQADAPPGPSSLFLFSTDNPVRRYTRFIIEWPYPF